MGRFKSLGLDFEKNTLFWKPWRHHFVTIVTPMSLNLTFFEELIQSLVNVRSSWSDRPKEVKHYTFKVGVGVFLKNTDEPRNSRTWCCHGNRILTDTVLFDNENLLWCNYFHPFLGFLFFFSQSSCFWVLLVLFWRIPPPPIWKW